MHNEKWKNAALLSSCFLPFGACFATAFSSVGANSTYVLAMVT
jgi:hypothetical protein